LRILDIEKMAYNALNRLTQRGINRFAIVLSFFLVTSCDSEDPLVEDENELIPQQIELIELPKRPGPVPTTTTEIPHVQIGVEIVPEVNDELIRRVYSLPGIEKRKSVVAGWQGLWINEQIHIVYPESLIGGREFGHIHDDGSLHIFLEPFRAEEAVEACWAIYHPFAVQGLEGWDGFVMLYTPLSFDELDVTFQLIVDAYNYITAQKLVAAEYY